MLLRSYLSEFFLCLGGGGGRGRGDGGNEKKGLFSSPFLGARDERREKKKKKVREYC